MTDQELLRAYADSSDRESLGAFVARYQAGLVRFVGRLLGDGEAAQDVVQDTFLEVARHPRRLLEVQSCHNWLLRVARNLGVTRLRREIRERKHAGAVLERAQAEAARRSEAEAAVLETEELRHKVRGAIDGLSPRTREVLLLKVEEDKSYKEIAEITGLSVTHVGFILHRAMKELTAKLNHLGVHPAAAVTANPGTDPRAQSRGSS